jgi:predicted HD phosphohydrolase
MTPQDYGTVSYRRMADATQQDYELLARYERDFLDELPDRLLAAVAALDQSVGGLQVTRLEHSLQSATLALRDGRTEEYVVACLLHDIGDMLAPETHGEMVEAILRPYIAPDICWIVRHHGIFQQYYYGHLIGLDRNARERYRDHPAYDACVEFCERYDQNCFDPGLEYLPLEHFEPMVRRVFAEPRHLERDAPMSAPAAGAA